MALFKKDLFEKVISTIFTATVTEDSDQYTCTRHCREGQFCKRMTSSLKNIFKPTSRDGFSD